MLFRLAEWNAFAKLRMHTTSSLELFDKSTVVIGRELRSFAATTQAEYKTVELPNESAARVRRGARKKAGGKAPAPAQTVPPVAAKGKFLNLLTYQFHALGDYVPTIRLFGTIESYCTQIGELAHRLVKRLYGRTNKNNATKQMTWLERRDTRICRAKQAAAAPRNRHSQRSFSDNDGADYAGLDAHHSMSKARKNPIHLLKFVQKNAHDPAKKRFIPKLKEHLLSRLLGRDFDSDDTEYSEAERDTVRIQNSALTQDRRAARRARRAGSTGPVRRVAVPFRRALAKLSDGTATGRFSNTTAVEKTAVAGSTGGGKILMIYCQEAIYTTFDLCGLWPYKIGFVPDTDEYAFGFFDPSLILRGCHIVPAFAGGRTRELLSLPRGVITAGRPESDNDDDWENFYVMILVDRDMFMRYLGGGIGHLIHPNSGWRGHDDAHVNDLPDDDDDADPEAPGPGADIVVDDLVNVPDVDLPGEGNGEDDDIDMDMDDEEDGSGSEDSEGDDDNQEEEGFEGDGVDSDSDEEDDLFDDEGYLDI
ncbi:hypothetical protein B0H16DRAFT_1473776 [Mycena metata]|uniref:Uncharacterized protein n=1 Tax=Mycena metata TaxID=1033252 RepID=A0AAD7HIN0_9AGAR|nr:hypothetical protein B0H16DRAFT_1473776 [Mycena metata]